MERFLAGRQFVGANAKGAPRDNGKGEKVPIENPKPGLYWLLPLTVAGDIATSPFQALFMLWAHATQWNG